ncbi:hypothetical protein HOR96_gp48 [Agrobacterium phage Atu_ph02]|uniref:Uncharacterized protein n=1 Tax=Agrobacterium phage Atu_ph02 TaxID=2024261 RepID=A0A2L0UYZ1_9CAUD|nr:hypothetical protein HOR96_gp48 [Agrobacterium phage Atu_ph02]AUZ94756.1 hypothetical protein [Agrobacterium phage Atu_ph02]
MFMDWFLYGLLKLSKPPANNTTRIITDGQRFVAQVYKRYHKEWRTISRHGADVMYSPADFNTDLFSYTTEHDAGQIVNRYIAQYGPPQAGGTVREVWRDDDAT